MITYSEYGVQIFLNTLILRPLSINECTVTNVNCIFMYQYIGITNVRIQSYNVYNITINMTNRRKLNFEKKNTHNKRIKILFRLLICLLI